MADAIGQVIGQIAGVADSLEAQVAAEIERRRKARKAARDPFDRYWTPAGYTRALLRRTPIVGRVLEPSAGNGAIVDVLRQDRAPLVSIATRDLHPDPCVQVVADMTAAASWDAVGRIAWVVMNPPFQHAPQFVELALERAEDGVAALVRLSFLEPVEDRAAMLCARPPDRVIVLPRVKFKGKGSDSVTCAWLVWGRFVRPGVDVVPRAEL